MNLQLFKKQNTPITSNRKFQGSSNCKNTANKSDLDCANRDKAVTISVAPSYFASNLYTLHEICKGFRGIRLEKVFREKKNLSF